MKLYAPLANELITQLVKQVNASKDPEIRILMLLHVAKQLEEILDTHKRIDPKRLEILFEKIFWSVADAGNYEYSSDDDLFETFEQLTDKWLKGQATK